MSMTKKRTAPFKLWIESPLEMRAFSIKREQLVQLFKWLDYRDLGRICSPELFAVFLAGMDGGDESFV